MVRTPVRAVVLLCATALLAFAAVSAQQEPTQVGPVIKVNVNSVLVPVVVRDAQGHAIGDLTKEDFRVFDKNKPLEIVGMTVEQRAPTPPDALKAPSNPASNSPDAAPPVTASAPPSDRFVVFLFDDLHISAPDLSSLRTAAKKVLNESLSAGDYASVLSVLGQDDSGVTNDRARLEATINKLSAQRSPYRPDAHGCPNVDYFHGDLIENKHDERIFNNAVDETMTCANLPPDQRSIAEQMTHQAAQRAVALGEQDVRMSYIYIREVVRKMVNLPGQRTLVLISLGFYSETPEALVLQNQVIEAAARNSACMAKYRAARDGTDFSSRNSTELRNALWRRGVVARPGGVAGHTSAAQRSAGSHGDV